MSSLRRIGLPLIGLLLLVSVSTSLQNSFHEVLDSNYNITWNLNSTHIWIRAQVNAMGYVGFGFSSQPAMSPGDVCIGYVDGQGSYFGDYHTHGHSVIKDSQQDWHMLSIEEKQGDTTLEFTRQLVTSDVNDIAIREGEPMNVIYAASNSDPTTSSHFHRHAFRGVKQIVLLPTGFLVG